MTKHISGKYRKELEDLLQEELFTDLMGENPDHKELYLIYEIVDTLRGAYNDEGIRRWFYRQRTQLGNSSPLVYLGKTWKSEDENAKKVLELAKSLDA
ncbi:MAG: hypothetical protein Q8R47_02995 [Nanoarchaeota archaeon]|nr:hypothetical protein [Nanoarchaeota archaeon]